MNAWEDQERERRVAELRAELSELGAGEEDLDARNPEDPASKITYDRGEDAELHALGSVVWDGTTPGIICDYDENGVAVIGVFADVKRTTGTFASRPERIQP